MTKRARSHLYISISLGLIVIIALTAIVSARFFGGRNAPARTERSAFVRGGAPARTERSAFVKGDAPVPTAGSAFVTRSGSFLWLNGSKFRFSGANIYWLGLQEDPVVSYPSHFRVDDALATAEMMGATVVRSHTLGVSVGCSLCVEPALGKFNQAALQHIDYAIQSAHNHGIKLIIPLTDNWHYYHGGKHTFTDWRGLSDENQFYSNPQVISDFEQYISVILNHVNSYTGIAYKNDPTILAWETGNELSAPSNWVQTMANYIKGIDSHHLIMDGNSESADGSSNFLPDLHISTLDLYTGHYYPPSISAFERQVQQVLGAGKVFIAGEYDWNTNDGDALVRFLLAVEHSEAAGDLYWALFPHNDTYGFVQHKEHFTLHYPGDTPDMRSRVRLLCIHAYAMQNLPVPTTDPPEAPSITSVTGNALAWRGAVGADTYTVERSTVGAGGPWIVVCNRCATDNDIPWIDASKPSGRVWYRVKGYAVSGIPGPYSDVYQSAG
jgi:mannan endo-1,4-beta-mannosidase